MAVEKEGEVFGKDKAFLPRLYDRLKKPGGNAHREISTTSVSTLLTHVASLNSDFSTHKGINALSLIILPIMPRIDSDVIIFWTM